MELRCGATNVNDVIITKLDLATDDNPAVRFGERERERERVRDKKRKSLCPKI